jgi:hypothetical protein
VPPAVFESTVKTAVVWVIEDSVSADSTMLFRLKVGAKPVRTSVPTVGAAVITVAKVTVGANPVTSNTR